MIWLVGSKPISFWSNVTIKTTSFSRVFLSKKWRHVPCIMTSSITHFPSILKIWRRRGLTALWYASRFLDIISPNTGNKYGGVGRYDVASLCFRVKWRSRVARVIEDSILESCQPCHQNFSLTLLTEKPWGKFGRYWQVTYFQQIVSNCSLPRSRFLDVIQRSPLRERARNCSIWRMRIRFSLV